APMFGPPGRSYVYLVYGMYHCLNVVAERGGVAGAVLLRGAEPVVGVGADPRALAGPGKLARALGLSTAQTDMDLVRSALSIRDAPAVPAAHVVRSARTGLTAAERVQDEAAAARELLRANPSSGLRGARDIRDALRRARLGGSLDAEQLLAVADTVRAALRLFEDVRHYPPLAARTRFARP